MKKYINVVKMIVVIGSIIAAGAIIFHYFHMKNKAETSLNNVAIQRAIPTPKPKSSSGCTPNGKPCSGTGRSSCCPGYGCCNGVCADTVNFGKCI